MAPRTGTTRSALPPHPPLEDYYGAEADKPGFVRRIFDQAAGDYDRLERIMALGSGSWYRRRALARCGLQRGMRTLDVATGTGLLAREAVRIVERRQDVVGLDPSPGMLSRSRRRTANPVLLGLGEQVACRDASFDFLSMGYALRHLADLAVTFGEFNRVLRSGGTLCILEITPPRRALPRAVLRLWVRGVIPTVARRTLRHAETARLWEYFWDTMAACVAPEEVLEALHRAGFTDARRHVELGIFSEYTARKV